MSTTAAVRPRLVKIRLHREADEIGPDESVFGSYGMEEREGAIDRQARGVMRDSREYRFYYPPLENYKGTPAREVKKYVEQDFKRMEAYNRDEWQMVGVWAEAEVHVPTGRRSSISTIHQIRSPGLWGIESDSDESHFSEVEHEELSELRAILEAFGVDVSDFDRLSKEAERK